MTKSPPITDSPWLWFALFTAVGLTALVATGGKFGKRQAGIERKGQARSAVAEGRMKIEIDDVGHKSAVQVPEYSQPGKTKIRLVPLSITLGSFCAISLALLARERIRLAKHNSPPGKAEP